MGELTGERALSFGCEAERYDRARPGYPAELIDRLLTGSPNSVLDVGCGTGKAGRLFAERGCAVLGVEPDARMAAVAREHRLDVEVARFEDWEPRGRVFELVVAGQAWHWVDRQLAVEKLCVALAPGRRFAAFWNLPSFEAGLQAAIDDVYARLLPDEKPHEVARTEFAAGRAADLAALVRSRCFDNAELWMFSVEQRYTRDAFLDLQRTHSNHIVLPPEQLEDVLDAVGAVIDGYGGEATLEVHVEAVTALRA